MSELDSLRKQLSKRYGDDRVHFASDTPSLNVMTTGSLSLDIATGCGGLVRGTIAEFYGLPGVGKTTLGYYMIAAEQSKGKNCAFLNLEGAFNRNWAVNVANVDIDNLLYLAPDPGEEAASILYDVCVSGAISLVVFDSVGAMIPDNVLERGVQQVGGASLLVARMVSRILAPARRNQCTVVFLNQARARLDSPVPAIESPGGYALKHAAFTRIRMRAGRSKSDQVMGIVDGQEKPIGYRVYARVEKSKVSSPSREASWMFYTDADDEHSVGIDHIQEIVDYGVLFRVIEQRGGYYYHPSFSQNGSKDLIQGRDAVYRFLKAHQAVAESIKTELILRSIGGENGTTTAN